ncbi:MAG: FAD:protein FMN transferase, partial [Nitrospinaceae bacterium]|nr:FAD:protein FMN transferase [Nitrospinaceae bacterium]NIR57341.1 FAD:protein FMN transferase [Nitrospinaceae bacterium]NIS87793.1 FAD:protein FMN transferase [Nitrospinaceae bacterium]NIT84663.1 FAD:protein FMN transferase [Nitrospinaceae bacterium]NIU46842.1 FAD:protein FMN transferase [Nitrospinaceae bacterium]
STHIPDSEISRINQSAGGKPVSVSPEVREVVRAGIQWAELTQGAFDITIQPVVRLWDFDGGKEEIPRPEAVQQAAGRVNYRDIELTNDSIRLARRGMALNVGGLAKGYAVDRAVAILKRHVPNGIINAGGDLYAFGRKSPQKPWSIGLQHPRKTQDLLASFELTDRAVATSGDYQRYFIKDGVRYHHIFDPQTGMPARGITSVTVLASKVMDADALSTAVFVMGPDKGLEWIDDRANAEAMVVLEDGSIRYSEGFRDQPKFALK